MNRSVAAVPLVVGFALGVRGADEPTRPGPVRALQGTWLFEDLALKKRSELGRVWESVATVKADSFSLSRVMGSKNNLRGTFRFDPTDPTAVDLKVTELDLSELLPGYKVPAGTLAGRYRLDGDRLTLCIPRQYAGKRPSEFAANAEQYLATFVRAPKEFKEFPKELKVTVMGAAGKPSPRATVFQNMNWRDGVDRREPARWEYYETVTCDADGTVVIPREKLRSGSLAARGAAGDTMGLVSLSPARIATGAARIKLLPQVRISGTVTCDELTKAGQSIGWVGSYLQHQGRPVAYYSAKDGNFQFLAPAGNYTLDLYGSEVGMQSVEVIIPEGRSEYTIEPIALPALAFALLKGKPAPELKDIVGWKGKPLSLAKLKGKYVLLEFWGYWCGPCIGSMPVLIEIHEKFADRGLAIVGIHMDLEGEVDTAAKLDAKLATVRKERWKGKDMPFPSALMSGKRLGTGEDAKRGGPVAQFGIPAFPTTLLIDREGKVVGEFNASDIKVASTEIEKLLAGKK